MDGVPFESALLGRHSVLNILAGIAVASLYGIRPPQLVEAVKNLTAGPHARPALGRTMAL